MKIMNQISGQKGFVYMHFLKDKKIGCNVFLKTIKVNKVMNKV